MTHWTDGPIAAFDVETTGVDVETDRIVTYCVGFQDNANGWRTTGSIVNPGVPISEAASQIHGVTDSDAKSGIRPESAVENIDYCLQYLWRGGTPVVIYNAPFDLTMLDREMRRHLGRPLEIRGPVIDPLVLDKAVDTYRKGSRRLTDVAKHYGVTLTEEDAHSAAGDAKAALQLAVEMCSRDNYTEAIPMGHLSLSDLYRFQVEAYREQRLSFNAYLQRQGKQPDSDNLVWPLAPYNGKEKA